jgi:hypothetical protein
MHGCFSVSKTVVLDHDLDGPISGNKRRLPVLSVHYLHCLFRDAKHEIYISYIGHGWYFQSSTILNKAPQDTFTSSLC